MAKKKSKKAKKKAKKQGQNEIVKYNSNMPEKVQFLAVKCGFINSRGEIAWSKFAKVLGVSVSTLNEWRDSRRFVVWPDVVVDR